MVWVQAEVSIAIHVVDVRPHGFQGNVSCLVLGHHLSQLLNILIAPPAPLRLFASVYHPSLINQTLLRQWKIVTNCLAAKFLVGCDVCCSDCRQRKRCGCCVLILRHSPACNVYSSTAAVSTGKSITSSSPWVAYLVTGKCRRSCYVGDWAACMLTCSIKAYFAGSPRSPA